MTRFALIWTATNRIEFAATDNPLVDARTETVHHGGNFQAMAVTNALEKARLALAHLGKLLFAQSTELQNPAMNRGLLMSEDEKAERHARLYDVVTTHTSHTWACVLIKMLLGQIGSSNMARSTPVLPTKHMVESYRSSTKRLFMLDYDVSCFLVSDRGAELMLFE